MFDRCVATVKKRPENDGSSRPGSVSSSHLEQLVDELNLLPNIRTTHPPRLLLAGPVYRSLTARDRWSKVVQTAMVSGMVLFVVGAARFLGWVLAVMQVPQTLASSVVGMGGGQAGFMVLTILVFLVLGAILEGVPAVVLLAPILLPLARELGIDPVHYGTVIVATQGISVFLPPVGVSLLVACSVGGVEPAEVARPLWPYLALMLGLTVVIALVPGVVLWLPGVLGY